MNDAALAQMKQDLVRDLDRHFEDLVIAFQGKLFAYAYRMSGCSQDAEEVVQDVFIRAYRALRDYEPERIRSLAIQAWLYRICINLVRNRHRRHRLETTQLDEQLHADAGENFSPTADGIEKAESSREMQNLISTLPSKYRTAVILRYVNELTYPEIAAVLEQPEGTAKSCVHRGLAMLRRSIKAQPEEPNAS